MSSAKRVVSNLETLGRSLTKIRKSRGPNSDPCGIPYCMLMSLDNLPFILVQIERFVRYDCNKLNKGFEIHSDKVFLAELNGKQSQTPFLSQETAKKIFFFHLSCLIIYHKELL